MSIMFKVLEKEKERKRKKERKVGETK